MCMLVLKWNQAGLGLSCINETQVQAGRSLKHGWSIINEAKYTSIELVGSRLEENIITEIKLVGPSLCHVSRVKRIGPHREKNILC